jgi:plasmid stabilization system protein ParE
MTYRVLLQRLAVQDLEDAYTWAAQRAPETAANWLDRFEAELQGLGTNPRRCSLAREHGKVELELRELLFGKRPNVFRAIFLIDGGTVRVLRIRRAQRLPLTAQQLDEAVAPDDPPEPAG